MPQMVQGQWYWVLFDNKEVFLRSLDLEVHLQNKKSQMNHPEREGKFGSWTE